MTKQKNLVVSEEFEENKEDLLRVIKRLQDLVGKDKCLKVRTDANFLLRYLRISQYDPEEAFQKMQTYYSLKRENSPWYITDETILSFKSELENHLCFLLDDRDRFGKRIYVNKLGERGGTSLLLRPEAYITRDAIFDDCSFLGMIDTSKTTMMRQSQIQDLFIETILDEEETQKNGVSVIVDLKNFSWTLFKWLTPANVCVAVKKLESLPFKKIQFHVVNTSALINAAIKFIWPFLSAKTKENVHFHYEDWPALHKIIDPKCLPKQYGGTKSDVNIAKLLKVLPWDEERFAENLRMGYK